MNISSLLGCWSNGIFGLSHSSHWSFLFTFFTQAPGSTKPACIRTYTFFKCVYKTWSRLLLAKHWH